MLSQVDSAEMNTDGNKNTEDVVHDKNKNVEDKENEHRDEDEGCKKDENEERCEQENFKTSDSGSDNEKGRASKKTRCDQKTQKGGNGMEDVQMNTVNNGKELRKDKNDNKTNNLHQIIERLCSGKKQVSKDHKEKENIQAKRKKVKLK